MKAICSLLLFAPCLSALMISCCEYFLINVKLRVWRVYNKQGYAVADLLTMADEIPDFSGDYSYIDPQKPWKSAAFSDCTVREM